MSREDSEIFSIGELARRTGLAPSALRYYEELRLISPIHRTDGGRRQYGLDSVSRVRSVKLAQSAGFSLKEAAELHLPLKPGEPLPDRWRALGVRKLAQLTQIVEEAETTKSKLTEAMACRCTCAEDCPIVRRETKEAAA